MLLLDWAQAIDNIRGTLPATQFHNWIRPLTLLRQESTSIVLGVPSRFHEEWLRRHYSQQISHAIRTQCGADLQLAFEIVEAKSESQDPFANEPSQPLETAQKPTLALSPSSVSQPARSARPALRVVENGGSEQRNPFALAPSATPSPADTPATFVETPQEPAVDDDPRLPVFQHPFFEVAANNVGFQCARLFAEGGTIPTLVFQGATGLGKTHLLAETGRWLMRRNASLRVRYTSAEAFTNEQGQHYRTNSILTFKARYADRTDVLLFDDVHVLAGRWKTQEVLLHCFNEITNRGGRIAFTTAIPPQRLADFLEPLRSRLLSGVVAEVRAPNIDERAKLLEQMAQHQGLAVDPCALRCLADQGTRDVRELFGALLRVHLQGRLEKRPVDIAMVQARSYAVEKSREDRVSLPEIVSLVEHHFGARREDLVSKSRKGAVVWARQVAMYLARTYTLLPLEEIGRFFGRDHATVIHAFQKVKETLSTQPTRRYEVEFLVKKLEAKR